MPSGHTAWPLRGLNAAVKYEGEAEAWEFTDEPYHKAAAREGCGGTLTLGVA